MVNTTWRFTFWAFLYPPSFHGFVIFLLLNEHSIVEVRKMENMENQNNNTGQDQIMNRVNQTFEQIVQDVKSMIDKNNKEKNDQLS
jgi:hypothetical protein